MLKHCSKAVCTLLLHQLVQSLPLHAEQLAALDQLTPGNCKHTDFTSPASPALPATDISNAQNVAVAVAVVYLHSTTHK